MSIILNCHSMDSANLNKSKKVSTSTTTASKYIPKRPRICINWNPPFQTQIYLVKVPLNVNIVKQDLLNKKKLLKILWSAVWKGGFQLIQILGLLGMHFEAVVVEVKTFLLLFRLALAIPQWFRYVHIWNPWKSDSSLAQTQTLQFQYLYTLNFHVMKVLSLLLFTERLCKASNILM